MKSESFCIEIWGEMGMFTTPQSKLHTERVSYPMPTYSALQGIFTSIYRQRGMKWVIEACRVMNRIEYRDISILYSSSFLKRKDKRPRFIYSYLEYPRYQIRAHYVRDDRYFASRGWHYGHGQVIRDILKNGSGKIIKIGAGNCNGYFRECIWGEGDGYYDEDGEREAIRMFHKFHWKNGKIDEVGFCSQKMINGIISFEDMQVVYRKWRQ